MDTYQDILDKRMKDFNFREQFLDIKGQHMHFLFLVGNRKVERLVTVTGAKNDELKSIWLEHHKDHVEVLRDESLIQLAMSTELTLRAAYTLHRAFKLDEKNMSTEKKAFLKIKKIFTLLEQVSYEGNKLLPVAHEEICNFNRTILELETFPQRVVQHQLSSDTQVVHVNDESLHVQQFIQLLSNLNQCYKTYIKVQRLPLSEIKKFCKDREIEWMNSLMWHALRWRNYVFWHEFYFILFSKTKGIQEDVDTMYMKLMEFMKVSSIKDITSENQNKSPIYFPADLHFNDSYENEVMKCIR